MTKKSIVQSVSPTFRLIQSGEFYPETEKLTLVKKEIKYQNQFLFEVDSRAKAFALCKGGLHEFLICIETHHTGKLERLVVLSQGRQQSFFKLFIAKLFFDELTRLEWEILYRSNLINNKLVYLGLKALRMISKKLIRRRLEKLTTLGLITFPTREWYIGARSQLRSFLLRENIQSRPFTKYSGYTKHYKDHGNLPTEKQEFFPFESTENFEIEDEILFHFLTVGKFPFEGYTFLEDDPNKDRNGDTINF